METYMPSLVYLAPWLKVLTAIGYTGYLLVRGLSPRVGFASWHMFVQVKRCFLDIYIVTSNREQIAVNPWDYLPHSALALDRVGLEWFLFYLCYVRDLSVTGRVILYDGPEVKELRIHESYVVD